MSVTCAVSKTTKISNGLIMYNNWEACDVTVWIEIGVGKQIAEFAINSVATKTRRITAEVNDSITAWDVTGNYIHILCV